MQDYRSDFADVTYISEDNAVLLTWKKFACLDDYRQPTLHALKLLGEHNGSIFVIDARSGFEDDKRDVEWGFSVLLPQMAKTSCGYVCFIVKDAYTEIGEEIDMWTAEFGRYFAVTKSADYRSAVESAQNCVVLNVKYILSDGMRDEFFGRIKSEGIAEASRHEPGCICYDYSFDPEDENVLCLYEVWTTPATQKLHTGKAHFAALSKLKECYVRETKIDRYEARKCR